MEKELDPHGAANVFASQMVALIALTEALVECRAVKREALIASLEGQMRKMQSDGLDPTMAVPLTHLIRSLHHEGQRTH